MKKSTSILFFLQYSTALIILDTLLTSSSNLPTKTINLFSRIPEKEKMIETLQTQLKQIEFDEGVIKEQIDFLLND